MDGTIIKTLHSDHGGKFLGTKFTNYLKELGTRRKLTTHNMPQHNGQVKRTHRTLFDGVCAVLNSSGLPQWLWGYALEYMVYVWNRTPKKAIGMKTPFEMHYKSKPNLSNIHRFGALVYYAKREDNKLVPRGRPGFWIGLEPESNGHYIYSTNSRTITVEHDIVFSMREFSRLEGESEMTWDMEPASINTNNAKSPDNATPENSDHDDIDTPILSDDNVISKPLDPLIMSSKHIRKPTQKLRGTANDITTANLAHEIAYSATISKTTSKSIAFDPRTVAEAMRSPDWPKWEEAMYNELKHLKSWQAWDIVDMPADFNIIDSKWVFCTKQDSNGKITSYCARLVACRFTQIEGLDYHSDDTYASIRKKYLSFTGL